MSRVDLINRAPDELYPDRGCGSWPSCLDCPLDTCINTKDKDPSGAERERARIRRAIVVLDRQCMTQREIAGALRVHPATVERGLTQYRFDIERARRKALLLQGLPTLEVTR